MYHNIDTFSKFMYIEREKLRSERNRYTLMCKKYILNKSIKKIATKNNEIYEIYQ